MKNLIAARYASAKFASAFSLPFHFGPPQAAEPIPPPSLKMEWKHQITQDFHEKNSVGGEK
jgi:hypothetical protein